MNILIIYNPNSTGDSERNARDLAQQLRELHSAAITVRLKQTTHAGHLEEIGREQARAGRDIVIISSSGDGGYHELVNGVLSEPKSRVITGVLPSGNANDHSGALASDDLAQAIVEKAYTRIDTLRVSAVVNGKPWVRYAHSYAGIGISAVAADDMTKHRPNALSEKWLLAKSLASFHSVKIVTAGRPRRYSSIMWSNIHRMSKVLILSDKTMPNDGLFEINAIRFRNKPFLLFHLLITATVGMKQYRTIDAYEFTTTRSTPIQLDGEVYTIDRGSRVAIEAVKQNLRCVL